MLLPILAFAMADASAAEIVEPSEEQIETLVVTASRLSRSRDKLSQATTIIERDAIEARQTASVAELLRQVPGINVSQQGGRGSVTNVILRGGEPNFTTVLIDGVKVNDPTNTRGGSYDFSYLDLAGIERVEIVPGPLSSVHGSGALAGVINIIPQYSYDGATFRAELGSQELRSARIGLGHRMNTRIGDMRAAVAGYATHDDTDVEGTDYEDRGVDGSLDVALDTDGRAGFSFRHLEAESSGFPEDSGGPLFAVLRDVDTRDIAESHAKVYLEKNIGQWRTSVTASRYRHDEDASSPGIAPGEFDGVPPNSADSELTRDQLTASVLRDLGNGSVAFGANWQREDGQSDGLLDLGFPLPVTFSLERETLSVFAEYEHRFDALRLMASLRHDDPDDFGGETSARVGALYDLPGEAGQLRFSWGEAFKAPSFFALGHPLVGNPNLVPESAESFDLGYRLEVGDTTSFEVSVYRNEFDDLVDFDPELFTNVNRSNVVTRGVEVAMNWNPSSTLSVQAHLTRSDSDIRGADAELRGRPEWRGGAVVDWRLSDRWRLAGSYLVLDDFHESSIPTSSVELSGYDRVDLALTFDAGEQLSIGFAVDNVFDADYQEAVGFPAAGIRGRVSISYRR